LKITLHIGRLVLEGFDLSPIERRELQASLRAELGELIEANGLSAEFQRGIAMPAVKVSAIEAAGANRPRQLGRQIAQSLYSGIGEIRQKSQPGMNVAQRK